jgi:hypothetical protein
MQEFIANTLWCCYYASRESASERRVGLSGRGHTRRRRRRTTMNRIGLWAWGLALILLVVVGAAALLTTVGAGYAKNEDASRAKCSVATLKGTYPFAFDGVEVKGNNDQAPFAIAGYAVFDGNGKEKSVVSSNFNGEVSRKESISGTYTVKADCTGTLTFADGSQIDLFIAPDGSMFTFVQTKPSELVGSGFQPRGTAKRVGD